MNKQVDYSSITESPNLKATQEQLERLYQRYHFARQYAMNKDILEAACGSGIGLGYLAQVANKVVGIDIEAKNVELARNCYKEDERLRGSEDAVDEKCNIKVELMDAHALDYPDKCFDLVLLYEAIYYLKEPGKFISEAERVLRKDGKLIVCTVNKDWDDFHPSPFTYKYLSVPELHEALKHKFREIEIYGGFPVDNHGMKNKVVSLIKRAAVDFNLIPGSLKTRAYLKRIFMGKLVSLPDEVYEGMAQYDAPVPITVNKLNKDYKIMYAVASK